LAFLVGDIDLRPSPQHRLHDGRVAILSSRQEGILNLFLEAIWVPLHYRFADGIAHLSLLGTTKQMGSKQ
jgi:hypothetical protein